MRSPRPPPPARLLGLLCSHRCLGGAGGTRRASQAGLGEVEGRPCPHCMNSAKLGLSSTEASRGGGWGDGSAQLEGAPSLPLNPGSSSPSSV